MFALPVSMKQRSIRKLVSELFEEGLGDVKDKAHQCQAQNNNFTFVRCLNCSGSLSSGAQTTTQSCLLRPTMRCCRQQQHVLTVLFNKHFSYSWRLAEI